MNMLAIVGSLRKNSYNLRLAKTIRERFGGEFDLRIADIGSLPHFNEDLEDGPPESVRTFRREIAAADGVFIITPEYNWSVPGVLKNALDWASRDDRPLDGKPVMVMGASNGVIGTLRCQLHLRQVLSSGGIQADVLPPAGNEVLIRSAGNKFNGEDGLLTDEKSLKSLDRKIGNFLGEIRKREA
ncbi:NADPH-dependent FMN reductase [Bhargavaea cecembensis]|uniref:NADPH-dependent FMN reductase n=2 Tax=Bhargavaea cecembensis TaxID=394098 RepID=UPI00058B3A77|nr:NADPH-dependent FMN reductase [Bhargavaea cecembensis]